MHETIVGKLLIFLHFYETKKWVFVRITKLYRYEIKSWPIRFRNGTLHLMSGVCALVTKAELEYWGIDELLLEPCCALKYYPEIELCCKGNFYINVPITPLGWDVSIAIFCVLTSNKAILLLSCRGWRRGIITNKVPRKESSGRFWAFKNRKN